MSDKTEINPDGRYARRENSKRRLLLAGLRMVERGHFRFTAQEVADRTGMHRRSIHDIFGGFDAYLQVFLAEYGESIQAAIQDHIRNKGKSLARLVMIGS